MNEPTIAEKHYARLIALYHGARIVYYKPGEGAVTIAALHGFKSGWSWELERYADKYWPDYIAAARAIIENR